MRKEGVTRKFILFIYLLTTICFALVIADSELKTQPLPASVKCLPRKFIHHSGGSRQSPGVQVGDTYYDLQRSGGQGQRIAVDDTGQIHVNWMYCGGEYPVNPRYIRWNFRFAGGMWYGAVDASPLISGYCQIDVMVADPGLAKRTMNTWHYGGHSWTSIDLGSGWGGWPGDTGSPHAYGHLWPSACVASNNNIIMVTGDTQDEMHHLYLTTDEGATWTHIAEYDSSFTLGYFVRASRGPGSQKVVHTWPQSIAVEYAGLLVSNRANDVWYRLSTDNGVTWGRQINITNYMPPGQMVHGDSTPWAFADVNAVFDNNDKLHIVWDADLGYLLNDTIHCGSHAKIFHWDEVTNEIHVVSSPSVHYSEPGGWWLDVSADFPIHLDAWQLPAYNPQLVYDKSNGNLYCLWTGTADTTDYSAAGYFNSEIYGAYSIDNGLTWSNYVNLTNTPSPGADSGDCFDEDYMTAYPYVVNDSIYITYIEDKDAGSAPNGAGSWTDNPVRVWVFHKGLILGTEEQQTYRPEHTTPLFEVYPNPFSNMVNIRYWTADDSDINIKIYDIAGKLVKGFKCTPITWDGTDNTVKKLPSGIYFLEFKAGGYTETRKLILLR